MMEINELKQEAKRLLDEINGNFERSPNGYKIFNSYDDYPAKDSFKERINVLRAKINALQPNSYLSQIISNG